MSNNEGYSWQLWETYNQDFGENHQYGFIYTIDSTDYNKRFDQHKGYIHAKICKELALWICNLLNENWEDCPLKCIDNHFDKWIKKEEK